MAQGKSTFNICHCIMSIASVTYLLICLRMWHDFFRKTSKNFRFSLVGGPFIAFILHLTCRSHPVIKKNDGVRTSNFIGRSDTLGRGHPVTSSFIVIT